MIDHDLPGFRMPHGYGAKATGKGSRVTALAPALLKRSRSSVFMMASIWVPWMDHDGPVELDTQHSQLSRLQKTHIYS